MSPRRDRTHDETAAEMLADLTEKHGAEVAEIIMRHMDGPPARRRTNHVNAGWYSGIRRTRGTAVRVPRRGRHTRGT